MCSVDAGARNFTIGIGGADYEVRLRNSGGDKNGRPIYVLPGLVTTDKMAKVVYSASKSGERNFYFNGKLEDTREIVGDFSTWDDSYRFGLGREFTDPGSRAFAGDIFLIAIYDTALAPDELPEHLAVYPQGKLAVTWGDIKRS